jgi:hypothetical protein
VVRPRRLPQDIVEQFDLCGPFDVFEFAEKGNINQQTFFVAAGPRSERREYLLQLLNPKVFDEPRRVMDGMIACIQAQQKALSSGLLKKNTGWEPIRLVPTREGSPYLELLDEDGPRCWRMMVRIQNARTYKKLSEVPKLDARLRVAEEAGRGLALFRIMTEGMDASKFETPLPGYRDTRLYYDQLLSVIAGNRTLRQAEAYMPTDPILRRSTQQHFLVQCPPEEHRRRMKDPELARCIGLALEQKSFSLTLNGKMAAGDLQKVVVHGDPKLDNFLFDASTGKVRSLIDLDTVMPHTWLTDWGDMVRSLVNVAGEREMNTERVETDPEILKAAARGFLSSSAHIDSLEVGLMTEAPQVMALELGVRFLADYLRGDSYFRLRPDDPGELNRTRAIVQFRVFEGLRKNASEAKRYLEEWNNRSTLHP